MRFGGCVDFSTSAVTPFSKPMKSHPLFHFEKSLFANGATSDDGSKTPETAQKLKHKSKAKILFLTNLYCQIP
jgi:hypothetical protein